MLPQATVWTSSCCVDPFQENFSSASVAVDWEMSERGMMLCPSAATCRGEWGKCAISLCPHQEMVVADAIQCLLSTCSKDESSVVFLLWDFTSSISSTPAAITAWVLLESFVSSGHLVSYMSQILHITSGRKLYRTRIKVLVFDLNFGVWSCLFFVLLVAFLSWVKTCFFTYLLIEEWSSAHPGTNSIWLVGRKVNPILHKVPLQRCVGDTIKEFGQKWSNIFCFPTEEWWFPVLWEWQIPDLNFNSEF